MSRKIAPWLQPKLFATRAFSMFWILLRLAIFILGALWVFHLPGEVGMSAFHYNIAMKTPVAIAVLCFLLAVAYFIFGVLRTIFGFGKYVRFKRYKKHQKMAASAFKEGLCAFFGKDFERAFILFKTAAKYDLDQSPIYTAFMGLSALDGEQREHAPEFFKELMADKDLKFLGYFGQCQMEEGSKITLLEQAYKELPTQKWVLHNLFQSYLDNLSIENISKAEGIVGRLYDLRHIHKTVRSEMYAEVNLMRMELAKNKGDSENVKLYAERAFDFNQDYVPAALAHATYVDSKTAEKILLRLFSKSPSSEVAEAIQKILPMDIETFRLFEQKFEGNHNPQVLFLLAILSYQCKLWGRSKQILDLIPKHMQDGRYALLKNLVEVG